MEPDVENVSIVVVLTPQSDRKQEALVCTNKPDLEFPPLWKTS